MKKFLIIIFILLPITVYGASFTLATYPINVNGQKIAVQPYNNNGTTYLPLRAISEALGVPITWDKDHVDIDTLDTKKLAESCVMIYATDGTKRTQGSAVAWDYGQLLTAYHVVDIGTLTTSQGSKLTVHDSNITLDASVLDSTEDIKPVKIGDSDEVKKFDKVVMITSPMGKENTVTYGFVCQLEIAGVKGIYINAPLDGGSSGGAVFNLDGDLIAIISQGGTNYYYAIPINDIRKAL